MPLSTFLLAPSVRFIFFAALYCQNLQRFYVCEFPVFLHRLFFFVEFWSDLYSIFLADLILLGFFWANLLDLFSKVGISFQICLLLYILVMSINKDSNSFLVTKSQSDKKIISTTTVWILFHRY